MWYNIFAQFYDRSLERLYRASRQQAVSALQLRPGNVVLDLPCGTGQSFDLLHEAVGKGGQIIGVDYSKGMFGKAVRRVKKAGWRNVALVQADICDLDEQRLEAEVGTHRVDAVFCALGLTAFSDWERAFDCMFEVLRPGGRFVILDVHAETRTRQTRAVELLARADLSRQVWLPLEDRTDDFQLERLDADPGKFGGALFVASGTRSVG